MNRELEGRLIQYADGDLPEADRVEVEQWLERSPEARGLLAEYEQSLAGITDALAQPPDEVVQQPWPGAEHPKPSPRLGTMTRLAAVTATVALLAAGVFLLTTRKSRIPDGSLQVAQPQPVEPALREPRATSLDAEREALLVRIEALERRAAALESRLSLQETQARVSAEETAAIYRAMGKRWERQFGDSQEAAHHYDAVLRDYPNTRAAQEIRQEANEQGA